MVGEVLMKDMPPQAPPPVVIYVNGSPYDQHIRNSGGQSVGYMSGASAQCDPYRVHREFPARWRAYIQANFRNISHVTQIFQVSEKTARNWWTGATGANGAHVAIAMNHNPEQASLMLFAAE